MLARLDRRRSWQLLLEALESDVADIQGGTTAEGIHLGAMAGTVDLVQRGYAGIEARDGVLRLDPRMPREIGNLAFSLHHRGHRLEIEIDRGHLSVVAQPGPSEARQPSESIFARGLWQHALWVGLLMAGVSLGIQALAIGFGWHWQTMVFSTLAFLQLGHALAVRSERESLFRLGLRTNTPLTVAVVLTLLVQLAIIYLPSLQPIFETEALSPVELGVMLAASPLAFVGVEIEKWLLRRRAGRPIKPDVADRSRP